MNSIDAGRFALLWGPGVLVLMVFTYGLMRLAQYWIEKSMEFKRRQMDAVFEALRTHVEQFISAQKSQADAFSRLASATEQRESHDSFEHQEILIALKAQRDQLAAMTGHLSSVKGILDELHPARAS
jgi:hypothetical protein